MVIRRERHPFADSPTPGTRILIAVSGEVEVNPAIDVDIVCILSGMSGSFQYVLPAGKKDGTFSFDVSTLEPLTKEGVENLRTGRQPK